MQRANEEGEALLRHARFALLPLPSRGEGRGEGLPGPLPRRSEDAAPAWGRCGMLVKDRGTQPPGRQKH